MTRSVDNSPPESDGLENWRAPARPDGEVLSGRFARLEKLDADTHAHDLFEAYRGHDQVWDYLPYGPFQEFDAYDAWVRGIVKDEATLFYAILDTATDKAVGVGSYLRIDPANGSIEVGHLNFSPRLQRTKTATEAMFLMMQWAFEAGYRRYEWKCDASNLPSRRAAERLGFSYEGVFRQATIVKGRNRDTAWFASIDSEWAALKCAFQAWLADENFVGHRQIKSLRDLTGRIRVSSDPAL